MKMFLSIILFLNFKVWAQSTGKTLTGNALQLYTTGTQTTFLLANGSGVTSTGTINRLGEIASQAEGYTQLSGYLYPAASGILDTQQTLGLAANNYNGTLGPARTTGLTGGGILIQARTSDSFGIISFRGSTTATGATTNPTLYGFLTGAGLWTLGQSGETGTHTINGAMSVSKEFYLSSLTSGSVPFIDGSGLVTQNHDGLVWDNANNRLGINTSSPSTDIGFGGNSGRNIAMERSASGVGFALVVEAGGAASGAVDANGGSVALRAGKSTGTGSSNILFQNYTTSATSSSSDNVSSTKMVITGNGYVGIGTASPTAPLIVLGTHTTTATLGSAIGSNVDLTNMTLTDTLDSGTVANLINMRVGNLTHSASNVVNVTRSAGLRVNPVVAGNNSHIITEAMLDIPTATLTTGSGVIDTAYGLSVAAPTGAASGNYAATFTGSVGMGGMATPASSLDISSSAIGAASSEPLSITSQRAAIVSGNLVGGIAFKSNDSNLTAPGINVAYISAVAAATHTASVLTTDLVFYGTNVLSTAEVFRISGSGVLDTTYGTGILHSSSTGVISSTAVGLNGADVSGVVGISNGGTNGTATPTAGAVAVGNGTAIAYTASGTVGSILVGNGTSTPIFTNTVSGVTAFASGLKFSTTATTITNYEEGTWTPTLALSGSLGTAVITTSVGRYTTIGNRTCISGYFLVTKGSGSGNMTFTNLPKTSTNLSNFYQNLNANFFSGVTVPANRSQTFAYVATNSATLVFQFNSTNNAASTSIAASDLGTTAEVTVEGCYQSQ